MSSNYFSQAAHYAARLKTLVEEGRAPIFIFLSGPLGAGKTTFVQEVLTELGFDRKEIQSPTFLKLLEYRNSNGWLALHMDTYRMNEAGEIESLGMESYNDFQFCFVEWPELFKKYLEENPSISLVWGTPYMIELKIDSSHNLSE